MDIDKLPPMLTINQTAELLNLCYKTVYKMCVSGELEAVKIGKQWRIRRVTVLKIMGLL
jgi:excisionase family DNA binding protein